MKYMYFNKLAPKIILLFFVCLASITVAQSNYAASEVCDTLFTETGMLCYNQISSTRISYKQLKLKNDSSYKDSVIEMLTTSKFIYIRKSQDKFQKVNLEKLYGARSDFKKPFRVYNAYCFIMNDALYYVFTIFPYTTNCSHIPVRHVLFEVSTNKLLITPLPELNNTYDPKLNDENYPFYLTKQSDGRLSYLSFKNSSEHGTNVYKLEAYTYNHGHFIRNVNQYISFAKSESSRMYIVDQQKSKNWDRKVAAGKRKVVDSLKNHFNPADYFVFKYTQGHFPFDATDTGYLSPEELYTVDSLTTLAANEYNVKTLINDSITNKPGYSDEELIYDMANYYKQIAILNLKNGEKRLFINALHKGHIDTNMIRKIMIKTADGGKYYFQVSIDLPAKTYSRFRVNGL